MNFGWGWTTTIILVPGKLWILIEKCANFWLCFLFFSSNHCKTWEPITTFFRSKIKMDFFLRNQKDQKEGIFKVSYFKYIRTLPEKLLSFARLLSSHTLMRYHKFCPYGGKGENIVIKNFPVLKAYAWSIWVVHKHCKKAENEKWCIISLHLYILTI